MDTNLITGSQESIDGIELFGIEFDECHLVTGPEKSGGPDEWMVLIARPRYFIAVVPVRRTRTKNERLGFESVHYLWDMAGARLVSHFDSNRIYNYSDMLKAAGLLQPGVWGWGN